nr:hypothetical protein GCM10020093_044530 [Planobispora longispora]
MWWTSTGQAGFRARHRRSGPRRPDPRLPDPWLEIPGIADRLSAWSEIVGLDLIAYGTTADADEIRDTAVAQPLLVAAGLAAAEVLGVVPPPARPARARPAWSPGTASAS